MIEQILSNPNQMTDLVIELGVSEAKKTVSIFLSILNPHSSISLYVSP